MPTWPFVREEATRARGNRRIYERRHVLGYADIREDTYQGILLIWANQTL